MQQGGVDEKDNRVDGDDSGMGKWGEIVTEEFQVISNRAGGGVPVRWDRPGEDCRKNSQEERRGDKGVGNEGECQDCRGVG